MIKKSIIPVLLVAVLATAWAVNNRRAHDFTGKCYTCHVGPSDPYVLTKNVDYLCLRCHPEQREMSHPVGIAPARKLPAEFPLYNGRIRCITCHIAHENYNADGTGHGGDESGPNFLRFKTAGRLFCFQCHAGEGGTFYIDTVETHAMSSIKAHSLSRDTSLNSVLDDGSRECLSCHDGTLSTDPGTNVMVSGVTWEHGKNVGVSHPIGFEYKKAFAKKPNKYRHASALDARLRLFNGKIGCQTCHDHYSRIPKFLVMENRNSSMCLSCHAL